MIIRVLFSLILGLLSSLLVLENDPSIKNALGNYCIEMFESAMHCHMKCTIASLDMLGRTIILENVDVSPREQAPDAWHWTCKRYKIKISLLALIMRKVISMDMILEDINASSKLEKNELAIMPHLKLLVSFSAAAALELKSLSLRRVRLASQDLIEGHGIDIGFNSDTRFVDSTLKTVFYWTRGTIAYAHRTLFQDVRGSITCDIQTTNFDPKESIKSQIDCSFIVPQLRDSDKRCFINALYEHGAATAHIKSAHDTLIAGPLKIKITQEGVVAGAVLRAPVDYVWMIARNDQRAVVPQGSCMLRVQALYNAEGISLKGACGIKNLTFGQARIASLIAGTFSRLKNVWQGRLQIERDELMADGAWRWDESSGSGVLDVDNRTQLQVCASQGLFIEPHACKVSVGFNKQCVVEGSYNVNVLRSKTDAQDIIKGSINADLNGLSINGMYNAYSYALSASYNPCLQLTQLNLKNGKNEEICHIKGCGAADGACKGVVKLNSVKPVIKYFTNYDFQGEGTLKLCGMVHNNTFIMKAKLEDATIRIPQTYMCITGFDSLFCINPLARSLTVKYAKLQLYEGAIICRNGVTFFDSTLRPTYIQVPLSIDHCLFNLRKDLFGVLTGNLLFTKDNGRVPHVSGVLLLDRAQLTEKLFSGVLHDVVSQVAPGLKAENPLDATCDLKFGTYAPIRINTVFLDAEARLNMHIMGHILDPIISGAVTFSSGRLIFPYKPLNITKAVIRLSPGALSDPLIEIVAKNRIKKYMISLQVAGSLQNHQIVLSATPSLSTQQILGLLLVGSEEESLGNMVPALVMQNIKPLIFGTGQTRFLEKYFNILLKPLQYIHFVPSFGDQTGRGGLRGKLEIDINDRWRAMIQNNFNLSEDTRFEIEYMISDDISLKGGRDEHRDITGEVEMRWKFK